MYGVPLLCSATLVASAGAPLPVSLLLIAAGSFSDHGEMSAPLVIVGATASAVLGDQFGFVLGRWGDRKLANRISRWLGGQSLLDRAEAHAKKWGGLSIFLTRWLFTPLGPWVNLASGFAGYPWYRFLIWDVLGELLWVTLYVLLGDIFSHHVQDLNSTLANLTWALLGLAVACALTWKIYRHTQNNRGGRTAGAPR